MPAVDAPLGRTIAGAGLDAQLLEGLACAALCPPGQGVLVLDATPHNAWQIACIYRELLSPNDTDLLRAVELPAGAVEDELWGLPPLFQRGGNRRGGPRTANHAGLLAPPEEQPGRLYAHSRKLVIVGALGRLGLAAARAAIVALDAPVVHVERLGHSRQWAPRLHWLAFAAREELRFLSPHLLDRFSVRLGAEGWRSSPVLQENAADEELNMPALNLPPAEAELLARLKAGVRAARLSAQTGTTVALAPPAWDALWDIADTNRNLGMRRELALGRMAVALAQLRGLGEAGRAEIVRAGEIMGWQLPAAVQRPAPLPPPLPSPTLPPGFGPPLPPSVSGGAPAPQPVYLPEDVYEWNPPAPPPSAFPEDAGLREETAASLRLPSPGREQQREEHGQVIGALPARDLRDVAILPTFYAAAPYQRVRGWRPGHPLILLPPDLRRHRRTTAPRWHLIAVLDQSDSLDRSWVDAMQQHVQWAYQRRAALTVISVGASTAEPRRAQVTLLQSRRAEAIQRVLRLPQGHATPLAHGLFLAQQQVRQLRSAGRVARGHIRLVVATDGRGNVPLAASLQPEASPPPYKAADARADALRLATALGEMGVQAVVLDPAPKELPALPAELAAALGALLLPVDASALASEP